jgi:thiol-disulfide isomerase/thioredoxin
MVFLKGFLKIVFLKSKSIQKMKKFLAVLLLISSLSQAQFSINGTLTSSLDIDWVVLYKTEDSKQRFVQNTTIKKDSIFMNGSHQTIGTFQFELPAGTEIGSYKINYRTSGEGFVDFIFNKENVRFAFHPDYPEQTVLFSESKENIMYKNYLTETAAQQQKLDSLQITSINNKQLDLNVSYQAGLSVLNNVQQKYVERSKKMYVHSFIKAGLRANPLEIKPNIKEYISHVKTAFFNNIDFSNQALINSSFLLDKITNYIFYINYSENVQTQQRLYKKAIGTVFSKVKNTISKKNIIEFLIGKFEENKNLEIIDFLFESYYDQLPKSLINETFKNEKLALLETEIGRKAPNFSWKENGKDLQLSTLNEAKNYVLVFWSTACSHCLKEIPELHTFLKNQKDIKVVAFAMEKNKLMWTNMKTALPNWHHVLGLNKWQNKTALTYSIVATPTYFILDANKKIIAKPNRLKDLEAFVYNLKKVDY